ncbi:MAG: DNA polymerase III subunit beta, partial [Synergistaceae bacterium]|nr:DNA polymerase III subunit beta [Synergistaceae bacterium]
MKLIVNKKQFLQNWSLAERSSSSSSTMSILSSVLVKATFEEVTLQATDIRTSIICKASGITVEEPGEAVFPIKMVGDLFKKAPGEEFYISVDDGKVKLTAGRSK